MRSCNFREHSDYYKNALFKTYAPHFIDDLEDELKVTLDACTSLDGVALYRAQGEAQLLKDLLSILVQDNTAPSMGEGISGIC